MKRIKKVTLMVLPLAMLCACSKKETAPAAAPAQASENTTATKLQNTVTEVKEKVQQTAADVSQKASAEAEKVKAQAQDFTAKAEAQAQKAKDELVQLREKAAAQPANLTPPAEVQTEVAKTEAVSGTAKLQAQAQTVIDQASKLVANTKYADAATKLKELANYKLSPEQQKTVDNLGEQIKKAMASDAGKSVGNLFK